MSIPLVPPRQITDAEAGVITQALIVAPLIDVSADLLASIPSLHVMARCGCGCDSVDFTRTTSITRLADSTGTAPSGDHVGVIVWGTTLGVEALEVYNYSDQPACLPVVASML